MRSLLFSACIFGCLATTPALAAERIVVSYSQADLATETSISALYEKIAAAATKLCHDEAGPAYIIGDKFERECQQTSLKKAIVAANVPALSAYAEQIGRGEYAVTKSRTLASR